MTGLSRLVSPPARASARKRANAGTETRHEATARVRLTGSRVAWRR